jgi:uncharacterized Ntn-hydrolase superfamily protein
MRGGSSAAEDVTEVTFKDPKRDRRQLSALDPAGRTSRFTGARSVAVAASREARHVIAAGNMFASEAALDTALEGGVRPIRTSLSKDRIAAAYAPQRPRHSVRAAARFFLKLALE